MKYVRTFLQSVIVATVLLLLILSIHVPGQTIEPDEQIKREMIAYAKNAEENLMFSRPRIIQQTKSFTAINQKQNINDEISGRKISSEFSSLEKQAFDLINQKRAIVGLEPLRWNGDLVRVARIHSENMARYKFFSHTGIDGAMVNNRADAFGISHWRSIGENIAYNRGFKKPVESACEQWMLSSAHKENILDKRWKETGIGVAMAADGTYFFTQVFILR